MAAENDLDDLFGALDGQQDLDDHDDDDIDQQQLKVLLQQQHDEKIQHDIKGGVRSPDRETVTTATTMTIMADPSEMVQGSDLETPPDNIERSPKRIKPNSSMDPLITSAEDPHPVAVDAVTRMVDTRGQGTVDRVDADVNARRLVVVQDTPHETQMLERNPSNNQQKQEVEPLEPDKDDTNNETREIATGTSYDKSVRSYSAYPKHTRSQGPSATNNSSSSNFLSQPSSDGNDISKTSTSAPTKPAKTYPFPLDPFQKQAIQYIEREESVLVAAHTSAGKTVCAEYAIAKSLQAGQRVVYTSPIKALSNQKYRDLQEEFGNVGLMTGDMTINPDATALVMTTEILRSMLYRGSELMREVAWVIYDEVHYMRDAERGVVWEESIILLPHRVRFVFLSATIPNAAQFADWLAAIHHQPCHVVYTNYRPVPLQHYIFPQGGDGLHLVVDEMGKFRQGNFQRAMATLQAASSSNMDAALAEALMSSGNGKKGAKGGRNNNNSTKKKRNDPLADLFRIVKLVMDRNLHPCIIFSFSKKDCERYALALKHEDYTEDVEKDLISQVYLNAIEALREDDRKLPQVEALLPLLKRGIGIHHGGLLPILKEIVEILFSEGLIKALFATETFSIGINMPAKTVIFTKVRKWDGHETRWLSCGEYTQMSGRAGRRGLDKKGTAIQMLDEKMEPAVCKDILYGIPDPLNSSYHIKYHMLLNLMRVEDVDPEYLLRASFHQFQKECEAPGLIAQAESLEQDASNALENANIADDSVVATHLAEYFQMHQQLNITHQRMTAIMQHPDYCVNFLTLPGRFVEISIEGENYGWGVLSSPCKKKQGTGAAGEAGRLATQTAAPMYTMDVLLECVDRHFDEDANDKTNKDVSNSKNKARQEDAENAALLWRGSYQTCRPVKKDITQEKDTKLISLRVFTVGLENIQTISAVRIFIPSDLTLAPARQKAKAMMDQVKKRFGSDMQPLRPVEDMGIKDDAFQTLLSRTTALEQRLASHPLQSDYEETRRQTLLQAYGKKVHMMEQAKALRDQARNCQTISMKDDLKKMKRVLKRLGHVDADGILQTKGRTACEINTADELVVVELMFTGFFNDLSIEQSVAVLSCMIYDERYRDDDDPTKGLKSFLTTPFFKLQDVVRTVAKVKIACGIDVSEDLYVEKFNPGMMEAVYAWCKGAKFIEVQKLTNSFEGTTIRTLRRLEELVRQITVAAKAIGNVELESKFEKGSDLIKRDIVFCSSLYL